MEVVFNTLVKVFPLTFRLTVCVCVLGEGGGGGAMEDVLANLKV